ncbi:hypothetical protein BO71DRAFT_403679 [Aspergillus ellipticus CBS 707.79]|uniref:Uncharacterized protein n=1 Tax=Aspergillus ellipticus CBS 707.79 TaxID=1448320 RepID=A0A319CVM1_9EURO|nr:hypothetical protein BO71DRAFT_403679 [Aspergillus ellipticus CBS 707.79]
MDLPTEEAKLDEIRRYWPGLGRVGYSLAVTPRQHPQRLCAPVARGTSRHAPRRRAHRVLYHQHMDGVLAPTLVRDDWRQLYLDTVQRVCNEAAFRDDDEDFEIPVCHELGVFLKYASGVCDADFRGAAMAPFEPTFGVGVGEGGGEGDDAEQMASQREQLVKYLQDSLCSEDFIGGVVDEDLEVKVGFETGLRGRHEHDVWFSTYLYCRRYVEEGEEEKREGEDGLKDWAWRVVMLHADLENPVTVYGRKLRFDSIPEFLEWYSSWLDRFDMSQLEEYTKCCDWGEIECLFLGGSCFDALW